MREDDAPCCEPEFWVFLVVSLVLVSFAGITSGLALGLLSFNQVDLEVLVKAGKYQDQKNAAKILPLVRNEHLLLCTLLIGKTLAMEATPIFMDTIFPSWIAVLISGILVLAFVEIIPQAICAQYGLSLGANLSVFIRFLLLIFFPISYPISKLLDWTLGKGHCVLLGRAELKTLVDFHSSEAGRGGVLSVHETSIIAGALDLTQKTAKDAMTPISEIFSLDINTKLNMQTMSLIVSKGHSRIPIYSGSPTHIIGLILVKNLIFCHPEDETPIKCMTMRRIPRVYDNWPLYDVLNLFQQGHSHMAAVVQNKKDVTVAGGHTNSESNPKRAKMIGSILQNQQQEYPSTSTEAFVSYSSDAESQNAAIIHVAEQDRDITNPHNRSWEQERGISYEELLSFANCSDEEVIGIITMEDVLEELLQESIVDETDQYISVHNNIKINLQAGRRSISRSSFSNPGYNRRTPEPRLSLSSYNNPPFSSKGQIPVIGPTAASPLKSSRTPPPGHTPPILGSPSAYQPSRMSC